MVIYPAIDIRGGKAVRLMQGDFDRETVYGEDPVEVARGFVDAGARWLHVVDLDGARSGTPQNLGTVERICALGVSVQVGGGMRSVQSAKALLASGATRVVMGTALVTNASLAEEAIGALGEQLAVGLDVKDGRAATEGWEQAANDAAAVAQLLSEMGAARFIVTDVSRDGTLEGPNTGMLQTIHDLTGKPVIASGGVSSLENLKELSEVAGVEGVIVGRAIYEGKLNLANALSLSDH